MENWQSLLQLMDRLREPGGCPWDREQTTADLKSYLLEEAYEVLEAIESGDPSALREELGDLLFQIVFLARIAKEEGQFTADDVAAAVTEKMIRRHPHVFGDSEAATSGEVLRQWEEIKKRERRDSPSRSALDGIPKGLPALLAAQRLGTKAARIGFDWAGASQVLEKVEEEISELREAIATGDSERSGEELGDILFTIASLGRHLGVEPETSLTGANRRFSRRFRTVERLIAESGERAEDLSPERLDELWEEAKRREAQAASGGDNGSPTGSATDPGE